VKITETAEHESVRVPGVRAVPEGAAAPGALAASEGCAEAEALSASTVTPASGAILPPGRQWTLTTVGGHVTSGYLPGWAEEDPSANGVPLDRLAVRLDDICHRAPFEGQTLRLATGGYGPGEETPVFAGHIECRPDPDEGRPALPVAHVHLIHDVWAPALDPAALSDFAATLRAQADRLEHEVLPRLIAYREDWTEHHGA
jgi:hypothetical protein